MNSAFRSKRLSKLRFEPSDDLIDDVVRIDRHPYDRSTLSTKHGEPGKSWAAICSEFLALDDWASKWLFAARSIATHVATDFFTA